MNWKDNAALHTFLLFLVFWVTVRVCLPPVELMAAGWDQASFTLHGRVTDRDGNSLVGAEVALYTTADVHRPVDFLTPSTNESGGYAIAVPPGKYWVVARQRLSGRYGPLQPTDRHSGSPVEIVGKASEMVTADFTVATIREMSEERQSLESDSVILRSRLTNDRGVLIGNAYLFARKAATGVGMPDFISPGVDLDGETSLLLPPGSYFVGADVVFPPREGYALQQITLTPGSKEIFINLEVP